MTPCVSSGLKHSTGEGTLLLGRALWSWTACLVCSVSAVVNAVTHRQLKTRVGGARWDCGVRLAPLIPEAMCCSHSGLHSSQGETEWLLDEREPGASWAGAPGRRAWKCWPLSWCAPRLVAQTSGSVGL